MKNYNKLLLLLFAALPLSITSCSEDEESTSATEVPKLALEQESLEVKVGEKTTLKIKEGGGEYKAFSLNENIAKVEMADHSLIVEGVVNGETSLIISDNDNCYQRVAVSSYYDKLIVNKETVDIKVLLGSGAKSTIVKVMQGNGGYKASSDSEDVTVSVSNNDITVKALGKEGSATITVTDSRGLTVLIPVQVTSTTEPYDEEELSSIKDNTTLRFYYDNKTVNNGQSSYTILNSKEENLNLYGWDYWGGYQVLKIYFPGDHSVGEKPDSKLSSKTYSENIENQPIKFEIIKNDGTMIWAVYSFVKNDKVYFGHFCQNINP